MKTLLHNFKLIFILIITVTLLNSCDKSIIGIKGKGDTVKQEILISDFDQFDLAIDADVSVIKGNVQSVEILAQQNIIDNIRTEVKSGKWIISYTDNVRTHDPITIIIIVPEISGLYLSGSGTIFSDDTFDSDEIETGISGSGDIDFILNCDKLNMSVSGSGSIEIKGICLEQVISISGSGDYYGFGLISDICDISIPGSGKCEVFVNDILNVNISGSGTVYYKGNPVVNSFITGSGDVIESN